MSRVIHFEIPVDKPERAMKFYANCFGWEIGAWGGPADYFLATTGPVDEPCINGALTRRSSTWAAYHIAVASVDETLKKIQEAGGKLAAPKSTIPGVGYAAYCRDTEGNAIAIFQEDATAG